MPKTLSRDKLYRVIKFNKEEQMVESNTVRDEILTTATKLFMQDGYKNTSTRKIADTLGIKQPVIYYYFDNKVVLYMEVLTAYTNEIGLQLNSIATSNNNVEIKLTQMTTYLVNESHIDLGQIMRDTMSVFTGNNHGALFKMWHESYVTPFTKVFSEVDNLRTDIELSRIVMQYLRIITAYVTTEYIHKAESEIKETVSIFLRGIQA